MDRSSDSQSAIVTRIFIAVVLLTVAARAVHFLGEPLAWASAADNDDIMRLLSVRAWLAGQGWFDMHQYRMMPPDGLDMHWSRYIDAAIAGLVTLLSHVLPPLQAENVALVAWPTLLLAALVILTGEVARRIFGASAAILAILSLLLWPPIGLGNFAPYRIDHHNVQILMISVMVFSLIVPGRPRVLGLVGGLAAAVSFAIGMEMLLVIGLVGVILAIRAMLQGPGTADQLAAFGVTLAVGSLALFAGQTAPAAWGVAHCDQLSLPQLALTGMAALVALTLARVVAPLSSPRSRAVLFIAISAAAGAALFPLLSPCLRGPYGDLPADAQAIIYARIMEARGLLDTIGTNANDLVRLFLPAFLGVAFAGLAFAQRRRQGLASASETRAVGTLLIFATLGLVGSLSQMRMLLLAAPAVPLLTGYGLAMMMGGAARTGLAAVGRTIAVLVAMLATIFLPLLDVATRPAGAGPWGNPGIIACRSHDALSTLSVLPKGSVLAPIDFGASVILFSPHDAVAGPYHRSPEAFLNGFLPFEGDESTLRAAMDRTGADYLLLCRDVRLSDGTSMADRLVEGERVDWLEPVAGVAPELLVLRRTGG